VLPVYPAAARAARLEGTVIIEAIIAADGTVRDARVLRSIPLLDRAALDAVRQWRYRPTTLNGTPVEVVMTVTLTFTIR
jgi:protein TonB